MKINIYRGSPNAEQWNDPENVKANFFFFFLGIFKHLIIFM